jgi:ribonuclease E
MTVRARTPVALYILNQKRPHLRDLERRFGVSILVEADDTLTGVNHHALERGEPASGAKAEEPAEARHAGYGAPPADGEEFLIEAEAEAPEEEEAVETEAAADEFEAEAGRSEAEPTAAGEGESGRPRRRRRRRRGGERAERAERPAGEGISAEAPQPTDDGLAAMAEIGGDFAVPTRGEGETPEDEERAPSSRRGRRGGGDRERFGAPAPTGETAPDGGEAAPHEGDAEPSLFDEPLREPQPAAPEAAPLAGPEPAPPVAAAPTEPAPAHAEAPAAPTPAAPANEPVSEPAPAPAPAPASEPVAKADEPAAQPAPEPTPRAEDPSRPRRSGWWQRARASLSGE